MPLGPPVVQESVSKVFDGIRHRSSVAKGINLVLFTPAKTNAKCTQLILVQAKHRTAVAPEKPKPHE